MLYLILITFGVFVIFWIGDFIITIKTVKHLGHEAEINPIMRGLVKVRGKFVYLFKTIEIAVFFYLLYYLQKYEAKTAFFILVGYIFFYSMLVVNNAHVYTKATGKESGAFKVIYVGLILALLGFIYLNYLLYLDIGTSYSAVGQCNENYNSLYYECVEKEAIGNATIPKELKDILEDLDLSIRR